MIDCYMFLPQKIKNSTLIIRQLHPKQSYFGEHKLKAKAIIDLPIEIEYNLKKIKKINNFISYWCCSYYRRISFRK